jgi:stromal membrane-associated protein
MWKSKLGKDYDKSYIEQNERAFKSEIDKLRKIPDNRHCADCGTDGTVWASVNLGVFLCLRCGSIHRGIGTHVSVPKGCTGTYLWGPDEIDQMKTHGNLCAREVYGGDDHRPAPGASDDAWKQFIRDKYEHKKFAPSIRPVAVAAVTTPNTKPVNPNATLPAVTTTAKIAVPAPAPQEQDLISFDDFPPQQTAFTPQENKQTTTPDFFTEFGV